MSVLDKSRRTVHHEHGVAVLGIEQDFEGARVAVGVGITNNVNRIALRPSGREHVVERSARAVAETGERAADLAQPVGRHHASPSSVRKDCQALSYTLGMTGKHLSSAEKVIKFANAQQPGTAKSSFICSVRQQAPRYVNARLGSCPTASSLNDYDGFDRAARRAADMNFGAWLTDSI